MSENTIIQSKTVEVTVRGLQLRTIGDMALFAQMIRDAGVAPKGMESNPKLMIALEAGLEVGLAPMQAIQGIAIINGRPSIFGDHATALVRASGLLGGLDEWFELDGEKIAAPPTYTNLMDYPDNLTAVCQVFRKDESSVIIRRFSVADAKKAHLWGKAGPWTEYPMRQIVWRPRSWAFRDGFADVLRGMAFAEEVRDFTPLEPREVKAETKDARSTSEKIKEKLNVAVSAGAPDGPDSQPDPVPDRVEEKRKGDGQHHEDAGAPSPKLTTGQLRKINAWVKSGKLSMAAASRWLLGVEREPRPKILKDLSINEAKQLIDDVEGGRLADEDVPF